MQGIQQSTGDLTKKAQDIAYVTKDLTTAEAFRQMGLAELSKNLVVLVTRSKKLAGAERTEALAAYEAASATINLTATQKIATLVTRLYGKAVLDLKNWFEGLKASLLSNPFALIAAAVTVAISVFAKFQQSIEESRRAAEQAAEAYESSAKSVDEYADKYKQLHQALIQAKGDEEKTYQIKKDLLDLQKELNSKYGEEYGRLNLVTDAYKDQTAAILEYKKALAESYLNENQSAIGTAKGKMTAEKTYVLATNVSLNSASGKNVLNIAQELKDQGITVQPDESGGVFTIYLNADATKAKETINEFMTQTAKLKGNFNDNTIQDILDSSSSVLKSIQEKLFDKYGETYDKALLAEVQTDYGRADTMLSDGYKEATEAVENFNNAVAQSSDPFNDAEVERAYKRLKDINDVIASAPKIWSPYQHIIDQIFSQADTDIFKFDQAIKDNVYGYGDTLNELKEMNLDAASLQSMIDDGNNGDAFDRLSAGARNYGVLVNELIGYLKQLGIIQDELSSKDTEIVTFNFDEFADNISNIQSRYDALKSAQEELNETGILTAAMFNTLQDNNLLQYLELVDGKLQLTESGLINEGEAAKVAAIQQLQTAMSSDIMNLSLGETERLSSIAQEAISGLGNNAETAGNQASTAAEQLAQFAVAAQAAIDGSRGNLSNGLDTKIFLDEANAIVNSYTDVASKISQISISSPSKKSGGSSGGSSGNSSSEKEFNWIERRRKMLQEEYSRLDKQAGNSFLTYLGISDSDITEAKNLVSTVTSAIGNNFSAVSAVLQDSGSSGADGIDQVLQAIQEYEAVRRSSFTQSVAPEEIFDDLGRLSSMADTAGLSLEEFIDLIQNGGNESRESALAAKIALGEKQLETYSEDVDAFAAKYQDALNQLPDNIREDIKNKVEHGWKDVELFSGDEADAIQKVIDAQEDLTEAQDVYYDKVMEQQSDIQELYENRIAALEAENDKLSHSNTLIEKQIEYMEASGQIVSAESYEAMIDNMEKQQAVIEKQIKVKKAELKALLESDEQFKDSEAYDSLLKSIDSLEEAYADLDIEIENTNNDLLKKPIENMSIIIGIYGDITTAIQNWGAEMQAAGQKVDADYYQALIGNGRTMISQYKEQADLISDIMDEFEVGSSQWNDLYNQLNSVNGEMSSLVQNMHEWNQELLQLPLTSINEQVEQLQQAKQGFENLQNDYDSVISTVTTAIDRQKEKLADENEEQNDLLQAQIDAAQERYDLLQDQNEQLDLQRQYEQALYDLQEANTQKTERVIRNGEITYEQNADNLRNAQESLQDALEALNEYDLQKYIDDLNDQLDDINDQYEDQIEALDKMAEKWKKIKEDSEYYYNSMLAAQYIGENWEGKILTGNDNDIYSAFKKDYDENAAIIDKYDKQITATENIYSLLQNYISSYQSGSLSYEQTMMGVQTLLSQMNQEMSSGQNVQNILGYLGAVNQTNADANAVLTGIQSALDESSDQMIANLEQYNDNLSLIADCMTSWETVVDNTNKMVDLLEEVRDNLEDALEEARDRDDDDDDGGSSGHWLSGDSGNGPGVHAKGILAGKIGGDANAEKDKMLKYLATHELESGQVPIIADKGEYVINPEQQDNLLANALRPGFVLEDVMKNLQNIDFYPGSNLQLPRYKMPNIAQKSTGDIIVNYTGDIKLTDVRDVDGFARAMASQFKGLMRQELGKR